MPEEVGFARCHVELWISGLFFLILSPCIRPICKFLSQPYYRTCSCPKLTRPHWRHPRKWGTCLPSRGPFWLLRSPSVSSLSEDNQAGQVLLIIDCLIVTLPLYRLEKRFGVWLLLNLFNASFDFENIFLLYVILWQSSFEVSCWLLHCWDVPIITHMNIRSLTSRKVGELSKWRNFNY